MIALDGLIAVGCLVGLVQACVWVGQADAVAGRRLFGVFAAPVFALGLAVALAGIRVPGLLF